MGYNCGMNTIESSITKFIKNLIAEKLVGKKFTTYKSFDGVSFHESGTHRIDSIDTFEFADESDRSYGHHHYDATIPSYNLRVSGVVLATNTPFTYFKLSIKDLP